MFLNPRKAIDNGWIVFPSHISPAEYEKYIQPNAIDFTIDRAFGEIPGRDGFTTTITETVKRFPNLHELHASDFEFRPGQLYDIMSDFYVTVPAGVVATLTIRSSFSRCGLRLSSGLYDSGFQGHIGATIVNNSRTTFITEPGTRIAQIAFHASDSAKQYAGGWNTQTGVHWADHLTSETSTDA